MNSSSKFDVDTAQIQNHYDRLSFWYRLLWGEHIHHGYWEDNESVGRAQIQLMERLAEKAGIPRAASVLDIGCGLGGSAFWLAMRYNCRVTGLTISPVQAKMAKKKAKAVGLSDQVQFQVADINIWQPEPECFDVIWIMEGSEHFGDQRKFYERCAFALNPGGILAMCAWLRGDRPFSREEEELITTIGRAMLSASLNPLSAHKAWMCDAGLNVETAQDITQKVAPTWDYCSQLAERLSLRCLLPFVDSSSRRFVRSFPLMKRAYAAGVMAFGLFVAKKCTTKRS